MNVTRNDRATFDLGEFFARPLFAHLATASDRGPRDCNQAPPTATSTINPTRLVWVDVVNIGRVCIYTPPVGDVLLSFPVGNYYRSHAPALRAAR